MIKLLATTVAFALTMASSAAWAENIVLRFSTFHPHNHWYVQNHVIPLFNEIEEVTEGRVKVEILPKVVSTTSCAMDSLIWRISFLHTHPADLSWPRWGNFRAAATMRR